MKRLGLAGLWAFGWVVLAPAQVTVEIRLEQDQFLPGEAIPAAVRITNRSGQTLSLGETDDWLTFSVERRDGTESIVPKIGEVPVQGPFELETSKIATKRVDLAPYFNFGPVGRYAVVATLHVPGWDREIISPPRVFQIINGTRMWEREFGLPSTSGEPPETRRYILQQANYLRGQIRLYLRIADGAGFHSLQVRPIGTILSFSRPEPQLDKNSNLHLLYQNGPRSFSYHVFNPDGEVLTEEVYDYLESRPRLRVDDEGNVKVVGGVRRRTAAEIAGSITNVPPAPVLPPGVPPQDVPPPDPNPPSPEPEP